MSGLWAAPSLGLLDQAGDADRLRAGLRPVGSCRGCATNAAEYLVGTDNDQMRARSRKGDIREFIVDDGFRACRDKHHRALETLKAPDGVEDQTPFQSFGIGKRGITRQATIWRDVVSFCLGGGENGYIVRSTCSSEHRRATQSETRFGISPGLLMRVQRTSTPSGPTASISWPL